MDQENPYIKRRESLRRLVLEIVLIIFVSFMAYYRSMGWYIYGILVATIIYIEISLLAGYQAEIKERKNAKNE